LIILIAEDERDYRDALVEALGYQGHTILTACNGEKAIQILRRTRVELIISDIHMPKCMGTQLHEMVRNDKDLKMIPFIYITGYSILRIATPLDQSGLDFMVNKVPFGGLLQMVDCISSRSERAIADRLAYGAS
jgi:CheY-like chemotaxis protein